MTVSTNLLGSRFSIEGSRKKALLLVLVLAIAAGVRIWASWMLRVGISSDWAVVASMARDMAEGKPFPVFFYGQAYMGSLEPWVASLFVRLLGANGFAVNLGTAALGFALLVMIFLWGRRVGGFWAGLAALAWSTLGNVSFLYFTISSRGGYGTLLFFGTLAMYAATHIASQEGRTQCRVSLGWFALMGLAGGLAWWSHPSAIVYLVPAAVLVAIGLRGRILRGGILTAFIGFMAGSAPWWWWNLTHQWGSLSMRASFGQVPPRAGIQHGIHTFARLMDLYQDGPASRWAQLTVAILAAALGVAGVRLILNLRRGWKDGDVFLAAMVFVAGFAFAVATRSHFIQFHQARYLLVLWPAAAVCLGYLSVTLARRWGWWTGVACMILATAWQYNVPSFFIRSDRDAASAQESADRVARAVNKHDIDVLYADYWTTWMNFATDYATRIAMFAGEKYAPWEQEALLADRIAFLDGYAHIGEFSRATRTTFRTALDGRILYDLNPSATPFEPILEGLPTTIHDQNRTDWTETLTDWRLDTVWSVVRDPGDPQATLIADFNSPESLTGIELWPDQHPRNWQIKVEARTDTESDWETVLDTVPILPLFWSGPRLFSGGLYQHTVLRWKPRVAGQWRFTFSCDPQHALRFDLNLLVFLRSKQESMPAAKQRDWTALGSFLQDQGVTRVFADRWLSQKLAFGGFGLQAKTPGAFSRTVNSLPLPAAPPQPLRMDPTAAFVVESVYADLTRRILAEQGVAAAETKVGPWIVFHFGENTWRNEYAREQSLRWVGPYVLKRSAGRNQKLR